MADVQIVRSASVDDVADYTLPGAARFTLKAVYCYFDDQGAGVNWLPEVQIISDSGHIIARAVDQAVIVTAGDDAEVSWFPGVKNMTAGVAGGSAPDYIALKGIAHAIPAVAGGDSGQVPWSAANYVTNDASQWTFTLDGSGNIVQVKSTQDGRFESTVSFRFDTPSISTEFTFSTTMTVRVGGNATSTVSLTTTKSFEGYDGVFGQSLGPPSFFECDYSLNTAASSSIRGQHWAIKRWPI